MMCEEDAGVSKRDFNERATREIARQARLTV